MNSVNDAPVAQAIDAVTAEDTALMLDLLAQASDIETDALTVTVQPAPAHGALTQNADGSFTYTPNVNWNGTDSFTFKTSDGELESNIATVTLTVAAVNDAPTAGDQVLTISEDTLLTGNLLANAADIDSATFSAVILSGPRHGQVMLNADGSFTYMPDADWSGSDSFFTGSTMASAIRMSPPSH